MSNDPISDLFSQPKPKSSKPGSTADFILGLVMVGLLVFLIMQRLPAPSPAPGPGPNPPVPDEQVVPADAAGYLFFIYERKDAPLELTKMADEGKQFCKEQGKLEFRAPEEDDPAPAVKQLIEFAQTKGIKPPCVVYKNLENKLVNAIAWPQKKSDIAKVLTK